MARIVVVVESVVRPYAVPFASEADAIEFYRGKLVASVKKFCDFDEEDEEIQTILKAKDLESMGEWSEVLYLDEGKNGVWTGFSSSDRASVGGSLPFEDEFLGNGDPNLYLTVGVPSGQRVGRTRSCDRHGKNVHPLYWKWLNEHPDRD